MSNCLQIRSHLEQERWHRGEPPGLAGGLRSLSDDRKPSSPLDVDLGPLGTFLLTRCVVYGLERHSSSGTANTAQIAIKKPLHEEVVHMQTYEIEETSNYEC
jgi:hypothetical protein